jgi:hypothetical protein
MLNSADVCEVTGLGAYDGECLGLYLKGSVDAGDAMKLFRQYATDHDLEIPRAVEPLHEQWRKVPEKDFGTRFIRGAGGHGAFPVTHLELQPWGPDRRP